MKSVVIGGAGFIGAQVSRSLMESGRDVFIIGRSPESAYEIPKKMVYRQVNPDDLDVLRHILADANELVDLAHSTVPKTSYEDPAYDILSNMPFSVGLLKIASECRLQKMIYVSSGGTVYGVAQSLPIDESHPTNPVSPYGITKLTIEKYAGMFAHAVGLPVVIMRPSNVYGESQKAFSGQGFIATAIQSILLNRKVDVYGLHGTIRDYLHVSDIARAIHMALDIGQPGEIYNISSGIGRNNMDVLAAIQPLSEKLHCKVDVNFLPERRFDVPANVLDSHKFHHLSGWLPKVDFTEGIQRVWDKRRIIHVSDKQQ